MKNPFRTTRRQRIANAVNWYGQLLTAVIVGALAGYLYRLRFDLDHPYLYKLVLFLLPAYWWMLILHESLHWLAVQYINKNKQIDDKYTAVFDLHHHTPMIKMTTNDFLYHKHLVFIKLFPLPFVLLVGISLLGNAGLLLAVIMSGHDIITSVALTMQYQKITNYFKYTYNSLFSTLPI